MKQGGVAYSLNYCLVPDSKPLFAHLFIGGGGG